VVATDREDAVAAQQVEVPVAAVVDQICALSAHPSPVVPERPHDPPQLPVQVAIVEDHLLARALAEDLANGGRGAHSDMFSPRDDVELALPRRVAAARPLPWPAMRGRSRIVVAAVAAGAALAGCGSGGDGTTLSKSGFLAKGDEICRHAHDQFAELQQHPPTSAEAAAALTQRLIEISKSELTQIRDLNPPPDLRPALDRYLKSRERGIAVLRKGMKAARDENARAYARAQSHLADTQVRRLKLAEAVGFKECSRVSAASATAGG
jgi:outer membrane murein-binding lipoprotein Lpp